LSTRWAQVFAAPHAKALYEDEGATLGDLREAVSTLDELAPTARRVLGGAHPLTGWIESELQQAQATLAARDTPLANA
jgi:hypothetical protein